MQHATSLMTVIWVFFLEPLIDFVINKKIQMEQIERLTQLLQSQAWRDKILRTLTFACHLVAARLSGTKLATRFSLFGAAIGRTRAFTRFLDDLPMLCTTLRYGLGTTVSDGNSYYVINCLSF